MDQNKSLSPAPLFMLLMILGNFMLLNLFLAILLKSISSIGSGAEGGAPPEDGEAAPAPGGAEGAVEGEEAPEEGAAEAKAPESPKPKPPEPAPEAAGGV
jgi:hypothetical protein